MQAHTPSMFDFFRSDAGRRMLKRHALLLAFAAAALLALFELTPLDRALAQTFFDARRGVFPLKHDWLLERVLHRGARTASVLCALGVVGACIVGWFAALRRGGEKSGDTALPLLARWRQPLAFLSVALIAAPLAVGALKHTSKHACPWDVVEFGGSERYRTVLSARPAQFNAEGCFPAAHPVTGFAWLALALTVYPRNRVRARLIWGAALALGLALGMVQMLRGAHFLSHVLWSAWVVWAVDLVILALLVQLHRRTNRL